MTQEHNNETDPYRQICEAMVEGLLITVNSSGGARSPHSDELRVAQGGTTPLLSDVFGNDYLLSTEDGDTTLVELDGDDRWMRETLVETIEIIGVREKPYNHSRL